MNKNNQLKLIWFFRILFFFFFFISAFSKIYPNPNVAIHLFEKGQFISLGIPLCASTWLSRLLIALEFTIAIGFIVPYYFRKITLPLSIGLLVFFTIYLFVEVFVQGKTSGNCGCFGQLIPMTPPVSLIKNVVALIPLLFILIKKSLIIDKNTSVWNYLGSYISIFLVLLILSPNVCIQKNQEKKFKSEKKISPEVAPLVKEFPDITNGKKILCYFSPTCGHCMETAKTLNLIKNKTGIKNHYIVFMNESNVQSKIDKFIENSKINADYKIIEFIDFPSETDPPAVLLLQNGVVKNRFYGKDAFKFEKKKFLNVWKRINF
jgi:thiol-disulfide isomerase/thioredoxin